MRLLSEERLNLILNFLNWKKEKINNFIEEELDENWGRHKGGINLIKKHKLNGTYDSYLIYLRKRARKLFTKSPNSKNKDDHYRGYNRVYMRKYRKSRLDYKPNRPDYEKTLRERALEKLGGTKCSECGNKITEALEINHISGGGNKERNTYKGYNNFLRDIIYGRIDVKKYNVLCRVCNARHDLETRFGIRGYQITFRPL